MERENYPSQPEDWYRQEAIRRYYDEGVLEIDENAPISQAEGNPCRGAYVQAWIWIRDPLMELDEDEDGETDL